MSINIIAAMDQNRGIGYKNKLLCHLNKDLQHFKNLTKNNFVVMGRKTYDSIGKPLPNRHNIILTKNKKYQAPTGTYVYNDIDSVIKHYHNHNNDENELFFIGGSEIYKQVLPYADKLYLTIIQHKFENVDSYFEPFNIEEWDSVIIGFQDKDDKNDYPHYLLEYVRKNK